MKDAIKYLAFLGLFGFLTFVFYTPVLLFLPVVPGLGGKLTFVLFFIASIILGGLTGFLSARSQLKGSFNVMFLGVLMGFLGVYLIHYLQEGMNKKMLNAFSKVKDSASGPVSIYFGLSFTELLIFFGLSIVTITISSILASWVYRLITKNKNVIEHQEINKKSAR